MIRVTVWNEFRHEKASKEVAAIYPNGLHATIAEFLGKNDDIECRLACLDDPEHGLTDDVLDNTDVLIWWGHMAHDQVSDAVVDKVQDHVLRGMGLIVLHSGHNSKIFKRLMGTSCSLKWRDGARERLWCANPGHPIAQGLPEHFELDVEEMYGEFFDIPEPLETVFIGWFNGGVLVMYFTSSPDTKPTRPSITKIFRRSSPTQFAGQHLLPKGPKSSALA